MIANYLQRKNLLKILHTYRNQWLKFLFKKEYKKTNKSTFSCFDFDLFFVIMFPVVLSTRSEIEDPGEILNI